MAHATPSFRLLPSPLSRQALRVLEVTARAWQLTGHQPAPAPRREGNSGLRAVAASAWCAGFAGLAHSW